MSLQAGMRFGSYEVTEQIGAGGMGEVYRATDTELKRDVAVKVLPMSFAADAERLARFQREAEILASLNHPNIAHIYGLERAGEQTVIVMELVDGPTLADRIKEGPIPPDEAMGIALQIVSALEAAHARQVVHRDLKPANVKLKDDGTIKVLDFGISKTLEPEEISGGSPVMTTPAVTQTGVILGTAAYMSPEQARGKFVDDRTDVWAFGCLLFEMLTGQPAFGGEDVMLTLARVLDRDTDLSSIPKTITPAVRHTLKLCLEKDPRKRIADIRDVRLALEGAFESELPREAESVAATRLGRRVIAPIASSAIVALIVGLSVWYLTLPTAPAVNRFDYVLPEGQSLRTTSRNVIAFSPDGRHFVYNESGGLFLRTLGELEARIIQGTEEQRGSPFFSPDGQSVAFITSERILKRISINGGAAIDIAYSLDYLFGASWEEDGTILFGQTDGVYRVSANGGMPERVVEIEPGERVYGPSLLPDGDTVLFTLATGGDWDNAQIMTQTLATGERHILIDRGSDARYVPTGHLVYAYENGLYARVFDAGSLEVSGGSVPVQQGVMRATNTTGAANFAFSDDGTLVFMAGDASGGRTLVWVGLDGRDEPIEMRPGPYYEPRISPDGTRVALNDDSGNNDIRIWNLAAQTLTRLTLGEGGGTSATWMSDERIAFIRQDGLSIGAKAASNVGDVEILFEQDASDAAFEIDRLNFFADERTLVFTGLPEPGLIDIGMIEGIGEDPTSTWLVMDESRTVNTKLSPNGRYMVHESDESADWEIHVRPFPNVDGDRDVVSRGRGEWPVWAPDGTALYYLVGPQPFQMMAVSVDIEGDEFEFGEPRTLFEWDYALSNGQPYDIAPDGQRFLALRNENQGGGNAQIVIVQNWFEELKRLAPVD